MYESIDLDKQRALHQNSTPKAPFAHQAEAFEALNCAFQIGKKNPASGMLVLPTGGGKTFTTVWWLCNHVLSKRIKVLWLAPSYYLLDQAASTFKENVTAIPQNRKTINIRCVSSSKSHAKASSIQLSDDIILMTTQTAIINLHSTARDQFDQPITTAFRKFIDDNRDCEFFIVVDEAHHAPAYGLRNLLIGEQEDKLGFRGLLPHLYLLGLTATPTHTEKTKKGWLSKIFTTGKRGIIYQADAKSLTMQGILAEPKYEEVPTDVTVELDDTLYEELAAKHKDLPEKIIENLASNKDRNNRIVHVYLANKARYGKTIIFADRWFQCVYLKEKLREKGVKVDAIYSQIDADPGSAEARNKITQSSNQEILRQFSTGLDKNNNHSPLDVLINVRMLTEGADVPSVQTVFITRQTTSQILMTQMIGRALRGPRAGGSLEANIVLFFDEYRHLIDWADPNYSDGSTQESEGKTSNDVAGDGNKKDDNANRGEKHCYQYIAIRLVEELAKSIESGGDYDMPPFSQIFPVGWYKTEIVYAEDDESQDTMQTVTEFVMVYEHTQKRFQDFIDFISKTDLKDEWSKEYLEDTWIKSEIQPWIHQYFDIKNDDIGRNLNSNVTRIVRHIAQNDGTIPPYYAFADRDLYDVDRIGQQVIDLNLSHYHRKNFLEQEFNKSGSLWQTFYRSFRNFEAAVRASETKIIYGSEMRITNDDTNNSTVGLPVDPIVTTSKQNQPAVTKVRELSDEEKREVKERDNNICLCCGATKRLQIDHVFPFTLGGETSVGNSQTLCIKCNNLKGNNEIDFRITKTPLKTPKGSFKYGLKKFVSSNKIISNHEKIVQSLTRLINFFYNCSAVHQIIYHNNYNDRHLSVWQIGLFAHNNPAWLQQHEAKILEFIHRELDCHFVTGITVIESYRQFDLLEDVGETTIS